MQALIASAKSFAGPGILVPSRNSGLLRWCLDNGLRVVQPMTLMSTGLYNEPSGALLPSVTFRLKFDHDPKYSRPCQYDLFEQLSGRPETFNGLARLLQSVRRVPTAR
ncbi:MAG: hypothetical protein M3O31_11230, partial [Acidobacteriota bacterium]|nr:hypothetical protein [Acidobacteriota bacterium]